MPCTVSGWWAPAPVMGWPDWPITGGLDRARLWPESGDRILAVLDQPAPKPKGIDLAGREPLRESSDPEFVAKAADVVGLYMTSPESKRWNEHSAARESPSSVGRSSTGLRGAVTRAGRRRGS
jgi:hypothetical protein